MLNIKNRIIGHGTKPANQFTANPQNPRKHPEKQRRAIAGSLQQLGWIQGVIENVRTGNLIDGHERIWQALDQGEDAEVPYTQVDLSPEEEKLALTVLDYTTQMAEYDPMALKGLLADLDYKLIDDDLKVAIDDIASEYDIDMDFSADEPVDDVEPQIDKADELRQKWQVETGQMWQLGEHQLICGDCTDKDVVGRLMGGEKADLCLTDPPYNVAYSSRGANKENWGKIENDEMNDADFYAWFLLVAHCIDSAISDGASIYLCHGDTNRKAIPFIDIFKDLNWKRSSTIIWAKQSAVMGWQDYRSQHECLSYGWKSGANHYFIEDRSQTTLWEINRDAQATYQHPTQKPVELFKKAINNSSKIGTLIFEPFLGSGTTLIACERLNRKCRAVEIDPGYVAVAIQRWVDATGGTPELITE